MIFQNLQKFAHNILDLNLQIKIHLIIMNFIYFFAKIFEKFHQISQ